jgi:hypothetical protein
MKNLPNDESTTVESLLSANEQVYLQIEWVSERR